MDRPKVIEHDSFQQAWAEAVKLLAGSGWERRNLVVQVGDPERFDKTLNDRAKEFADSVGVLGPKHVAYTIFPHKLYAKRGSAEATFAAYNRRGGLFQRTQRKVKRWGTYFRRMSAYEREGGTENQLANIIEAINGSEKTWGSAYTIVVQYPGKETTRPRGGPCLNYAAVQLAAGDHSRLGLLAVYRNHDFLERAYGNYWGLCNLIRFLAAETESKPGPLTCVSSHAYVPSGHRRALLRFVEGQ